jgi:hypothetical protein
MLVTEAFVTIFSLIIAMTLVGFVFDLLTGSRLLIALISVRKIKYESQIEVERIRGETAKAELATAQARLEMARLGVEDSLS